MLPVTVWGAINPAGRIDEIPFRAKARQNIVFDLAAQSLGSKLKAGLTLLDSSGGTLASQENSTAVIPCSPTLLRTTGFIRFASQINRPMVQPIIFTA